MLIGKKGQKRRHPYATLAVLSLAAAGAVGIYNKTMNFIKDKGKCMKAMIKKEEQS